MDEYREKLIEMVDLAEKQVKIIKMATDFTDVHMFPQLQLIREAKDLLEKEVE